MRLHSIYNKGQNFEVVNPTQLLSFGMDLRNKISIAILSPCCAEFHNDVNSKKMRLDNIYKKGQNFQVVHPTQLPSFGMDLRNTISIAILSPCCAEFHNDVIRKKMRLDNIYKKGQNFQVVNPTQLPSFGMDLRNTISIAILSPCCAEFIKDVNSKKMHLDNIYKKGQNFQVVNPTQLPLFGMDLRIKISIAIISPCCAKFKKRNCVITRP
jgi:hypothetical protein